MIWQNACIYLYKSFTLVLAVCVLCLQPCSIPSMAAQVTSTESVKSDVTHIATLSDFMAWYQASDSADSTGEKTGILDQDIVVDRPITLIKSSAPQNLNTGKYSFRIVSGGKMTIQNPDLILSGDGILFSVEKNGSLSLSAGKIDGNSMKAAITVKKNGSFEKDDGFHLEGNVINENSSLEARAGQDISGGGITASSQQQTGNTMYPVTGVEDKSLAIVCKTDEQPPAASYPSAVHFTYQVKEGETAIAELPVTWDTSKVNVKKAGVYQVAGTVPEAALSANSLTNPDNVSASLYVTVLRPGPLEDVKARLISVNASKKAAIQLMFPVLPKEVSTIIVYKSSDNVQWEKLTWEDIDEKGKTVFRDDFRGRLLTDSPTKNYVKAEFTTNYRPVWLRVVLEGSFVNGTTNTVKLSMTSKPRPGLNLGAGNMEDTADGAGSGNGSSSGSYSGASNTTVAQENGEAAEESSAESAGGGRRYGRETDSYPSSGKNSGNVIVYADGKVPELAGGKEDISQESMEDVAGGSTAADTFAEASTEVPDEAGIPPEENSGTDSEMTQNTEKSKRSGYVIISCAAAVMLIGGVYILLRRKR